MKAKAKAKVKVKVKLKVKVKVKSKGKSKIKSKSKSKSNSILTVDVCPRGYSEAGPGAGWILEVSTPGPGAWVDPQSLGKFSRDGWWILEKSTSPVILKKQYSWGGWILRVLRRRA